MDRVPQELVDHITSYLDEEDLKSTLYLSRQFQYAAERYSGAFEAYYLTKHDVNHFSKIYRGTRFFSYLRKIHIAAVELDRPTEGQDADSDDDDNDDDDDDLFSAWPNIHLYKPPDLGPDVRKRDRRFNEQIQLLFSVIKDVETSADPRFGPGRIELKLSLPVQYKSSQISLQCIMSSCRLPLNSPEKLQCLDSVQALIISNEERSNRYNLVITRLDLKAIPELVRKLPNLKFVTCQIGGDDWLGGIRFDLPGPSFQDYPGPRRDSRHAFASAVQDGSLRKLIHADLNFMSPLRSGDWLYQKVEMPNLTRPCLRDPFSSSLRILSYQLQTLRLRCVADESLFWPDDNSTPCWPNLSTIDIMLHIVSSSGLLYFKANQPAISISAPIRTHNRPNGLGFDITDDHYPDFTGVQVQTSLHGDIFYPLSGESDRVPPEYHVVPNDENLLPLLTAFAKATSPSTMPSLKKFNLWFPIIFTPPATHPSQRAIDLDYEDMLDMYLNENGEIDLDADSDDLKGSMELIRGPVQIPWGIAYRAPNTAAYVLEPGEDFASQPQFWWHVDRWRPPYELTKLFGKIGEKHERETCMYWEFPSHWEGSSQRALKRIDEGEIRAVEEGLSRDS